MVGYQEKKKRKDHRSIKQKLMKNYVAVERVVVWSSNTKLSEKSLGIFYRVY